MIGRILADACAWAVTQVGAGYLAHRVSDGWLNANAVLPVSEREIALYEYLHVRDWKERLPEAGGVFGGLDKRRLPGTSTSSLALYAREACRAELAHWLALVPLPLFIAWNPPALAFGMVVYAIAVNAPCIVALRYNRGRIVRLLERREAYA